MNHRTGEWWQHGIIYQIYPRSFQDSNGDGVGDLPGITQRLEYCQWLGIDAIWLSPIYPSPMADFGYDVADYCDVDPQFGTLSDFDLLIAEARRLGLRVLLDYIPNHTSDQHPWFLQSRSDRNNLYRDWYIWRDPAPNGGPPNNWISIFGGSAWQWDATTGQYYLHSYLKEQPDLNWWNPAVERAMFDVLRFWLDRGVSGFRLDAISRLIKDRQLRDNPPNPDYDPERQQPYYRHQRVYSADRPELLGILQRMRALADEYDALLIGEAYLSVERLVQYYRSEAAGLHFPFNFQLIKNRWSPETIRETIANYESQLPDDCWPNWVLGNHDNSRIASRVGREHARLAAMLLLTLRGTPTMYYGDEIGMIDVEIPEHMQQDPFGWQVPGFGLGRDPERTPMQWDASPQAGFTSTVPWLPVSSDTKQVNVERQRHDSGSLLALYRALINLRHREPALHVGAYEAFDVSHPELLAFVRSSGKNSLLVALNFANDSTIEDFSRLAPRGDLLLSTRADRAPGNVKGTIELAPHEGVVVHLRS